MWSVSSGGNRSRAQGDFADTVGGELLATVMAWTGLKEAVRVLGKSGDLATPSRTQKGGSARCRCHSM
jgi:hypothetical protein